MPDDYEAGRFAAAAELAASLPHATIAFLDGALANDTLEARHILLMLRNPRITPELIQRVCRSPVWMRYYRVRATVVLHPVTPRAAALGLLSHLRWRDLARTADGPRVAAPVRTAAEGILVLRLPELSEGERTTLARTATGPVLRALRDDASGLVARAILDNPRLNADDALFMAARPGATAAVLQAIARSPRFAGNADVRLAVAAHPAAPAALALRVVQGMDASTLSRLLERPTTAPLVRVAAGRRLAALPPAGGSPRRLRSSRKRG
jgi:hypothetical protein